MGEEKTLPFSCRLSQLVPSWSETIPRVAITGQGVHLAHVTDNEVGKVDHVSPKPYWVTVGETARSVRIDDGTCFGVIGGIAG